MMTRPVGITVLPDQRFSTTDYADDADVSRTFTASHVGSLLIPRLPSTINKTVEFSDSRVIVFEDKVQVVVIEPNKEIMPERPSVAGGSSLATLGQVSYGKGMATRAWRVVSITFPWLNVERWTLSVERPEFLTSEKARFKS